jgi:hypothetical protein
MRSPPPPAVLVVLIGLAGCRPSAAPENQAEPARNEAVVKAPLALPQPEPPLDRAAVLLAVIKARSAAATGGDDTELQAQLDGKRFEFRLPLGCAIAPPGEEGATVTYDPDQRRVELSVQADAEMSDPVIAAAAADAYEAAEGFWIADPWLLVPHCAGAVPMVAAGGMSPASAPRASGVALVQFFTPQAPRTERRRGRPYEARETLPEGSAPPPRGSWELVLTGRMQALADKRLVACQAAGPGLPPACVVSVRFDGVAIEKRGSGERLAEWSGG